LLCAWREVLIFASTKTTEKDQLIVDLVETFANLSTYQWKLNPTKCVFGVEAQPDQPDLDYS
jgi:hypothetical protein